MFFQQAENNNKDEFVVDNNHNNLPAEVAKLVDDEINVNDNDGDSSGIVTCEGTDEDSDSESTFDGDVYYLDGSASEDEGFGNMLQHN